MGTSRQTYVELFHYEKERPDDRLQTWDAYAVGSLIQQPDGLCENGPSSSRTGGS